MSILGKLGSIRIMTFECFGDLDNSNFRFLDGRTADASVGLANSTAPPFSGTHWQRIDLAPGVIALRCLGTGPGDRRFLDGHTADGRWDLRLPRIFLFREHAGEPCHPAR